MSKSSFSSLKLNQALVKNLTSLGYEQMTPIQAESLPQVLKGHDVIAQAKTGSGKTAAFGLGLLDKLDVKRFRIQGLILCPTRELADQVTKELRKLARSIHNIKILTLCGGMPFGPQIGSLEHGAHIVVGTPGRIEEHLRKERLKLDDLHTFVLDEADRMLDMGFQASLDAIMSYLPKKRQNLLFSATYPEQIEAIAAKLMYKPVTVKVAGDHDNSSIEQHFYQVKGNDERLRALQLLLLHYRPQSAVVFCNTKKETQAVADSLRSCGLSSVALHGDLEQRERDQILVRFSNQSASILVATDVAARGLDIESVEAVVNYHLAHDPEVHVHRIGRTGRAGRSGLAFTFFSDREAHKMIALEDYLEKEITAEALPDASALHSPGYQPPMTTLQIDGGRKQKVRPGDILGALTGQNGIDGKEVGKINIFDFSAYVAVKRASSSAALKKLENGKLKGRSFRVRRIRG